VVTNAALARSARDVVLHAIAFEDLHVAAVYGEGIDPVAVSVNAKALARVLRALREFS